jgi:hypothetical protein
MFHLDRRFFHAFNRRFHGEFADVSRLGRYGLLFQEAKSALFYI